MKTFRLVLLATALFACSKDTTDEGDTDTVDTEVIDTEVVDTEVVSCDLPGDTDDTDADACSACVACVSEGACSDESTACQDSTACTDLLDCVRACPDSDCVAQCNTDHADGAALATPLFQCITRTCPTTCEL
jgi:hypothetical protein